MNRCSIGFITDPPQFVENRFNKSQVDDQRFDQSQSSALQPLHQKAVFPPIKDLERLAKPLKRKVDQIELTTTASSKDDTTNPSNSKKQNVTSHAAAYDFRDVSVDLYKQQNESEGNSKEKSILMELALKGVFHARKSGKLNSEEIVNLLDRVADLETSNGNFLHFLIKKINDAKRNKQKYLCLFKKIKENTTHPLLKKTNTKGLNFLEFWDQILLEKFENCFSEIADRRKLAKLIDNGKYISQCHFENFVEGKYDKGDSLLHYAVRRLTVQDQAKLVHNFHKLKIILAILENNIRFPEIINLISLKNSKGQNFFDLFNEIIPKGTFENLRHQIIDLFNHVENQKSAVASNSLPNSSSLQNKIDLTTDSANQNDDYDRQLEELVKEVRALEEKDKALTAQIMAEARRIELHAKNLVIQVANLNEFKQTRIKRARVEELSKKIKELRDKNLARL